MTQEELLKKYFNDYPCYDCKYAGVGCSSDCFRWRVWFKKQWKKTTDEIKNIIKGGNKNERY